MFGLNTYLLEFWYIILFWFWVVVLSITYVVLSRPRIMIWHICSISVYILKFVTSPFIFIEANAIFQISSLKSVFSGTILYLFSFLLKCCYKYQQVVSLRISLKRFCLISFCSLFHVLIYYKIFKLKYIHFVLLGSRG